MRCEKCNQYVPEGLDIKYCPNCGEKITMDSVMEETNIEISKDDINLETHTETRKINDLKLNNSKKRKIIWIIAAVFSFIALYFLIPNNIYNEAPIIISFLGAVLCTFFLVQTLADFKSFNKFNTKDKKQQDKRHKYAPFFIVIGTIIFFLIFQMHFWNKEKNELKLYGEKVEGIIIDGHSIENRKGGVYNVTVEFKTKEGVSITTKKNVGKTEFSILKKGQKVVLLYSKKDPDIIELLTNKSSVREFTESEERNIIPKDLIELLNTDSLSVGGRLNKINYGWKFNENDSVWINERNKSAINIKPNRIKCITFNNSAMTFKDEFKEMGFTKVESDKKGIYIFKSEQYIASIELTLDDNIIGTITTIYQK